MTFYLYINGGDFEKNFAREFIRHICGGGPIVDDQIIWRVCTRKRLILTSPELVDRLLRVNQKVFWPNGQLFKCKLIGNRKEHRHNGHVNYHQYHHRHHKADYNRRGHTHENGTKRLQEHRRRHDTVNDIGTSEKRKTKDLVDVVKKDTKNDDENVWDDLQYVDVKLYDEEYEEGEIETDSNVVEIFEKMNF
jgi:uncharacterized protein YaiI (UPF0178 family)